MRLVTNPMTVEQLIIALQKLSNQKAQVIINVKQSNKRYSYQFQINTTAHKDSNGSEYWVDESYGGACITVHMPIGAFVSKWPND